MAKVPDPLREKLNARLRANGYSDFCALSDWMSEQGYPISKSAIHRYTLRLRKVDAIDRIGMAAVLATPATPAPRKRKNGQFNPEEKQLLDHYRTLPESVKIVASQCLEGLASGHTWARLSR